MTTPIPQRWLPGWFYCPTEDHIRFAGRRTDAMAWADAAAWLHRELYEGFEEWGPAPVESMHRAPAPPFAILAFEDCRAFADHALPLRQHQGVWGSDGQRCFYIIREEQPGAPAEAEVPVPPLALHDTAPIGART